MQCMQEEKVPEKPLKKWDQPPAPPRDPEMTPSDPKIEVWPGPEQV